MDPFDVDAVDALFWFAMGVLAVGLVMAIILIVVVRIAARSDPFNLRSDPGREFRCASCGCGWQGDHFTSCVDTKHGYCLRFDDDPNLCTRCAGEMMHAKTLGGDMP